MNFHESETFAIGATGRSNLALPRVRKEDKGMEWLFVIGASAADQTRTAYRPSRGAPNCVVDASRRGAH